MSRLWRSQTLADWLMLVGGLGLFVSLFLTWSHQLPRELLDAFAGSAAIRGVPRNPTAWQVYSVADVLLALLAGGLAAVALRGRSGWARTTALVAVAIGLAFTIHATSRPPTNGVLAINPNGDASYLPDAAKPGAGETVAIVALALAALGLVISLGMDLSSKRVGNQRR